MSQAKIYLLLALSLFFGCSGSVLASGGGAASSLVGDLVYSVSNDSSVLDLSQSLLVGDSGVMPLSVDSDVLTIRQDVANIDSNIERIYNELYNAYGYSSVGDLLNQLHTDLTSTSSSYWNNFRVALGTSFPSYMTDIWSDTSSIQLDIRSINSLLSTYLSSFSTKFDTIIANQTSGGSSMAEVVEQLKTLNSFFNALQSTPWSNRIGVDVVSLNSQQRFSSFLERSFGTNVNGAFPEDVRYSLFGSLFLVIRDSIFPAVSSIQSIFNGSVNLSNGGANPFNNIGIWSVKRSDGSGSFVGTWFDALYHDSSFLRSLFSSWLNHSWSVPSYDPEYPTASSVIGPSGLLFNLADNLSRIRFMFASEDELKAKQDAADTEHSFFDTFLGAAAANKVKPSNIKEVSGVLGSITDTFSIPDVTPLQFPDALKNALTQDSGLMWFSQETANDLDRVQLRSVMVMSSVEDDASAQAYDAYFNPDIVTNYVEEDQKSVLSWFESWWSSNG